MDGKSQMSLGGVDAGTAARTQAPSQHQPLGRKPKTEAGSRTPQVGSMPPTDHSPLVTRYCFYDSSVGPSPL